MTGSTGPDPRPASDYHRYGLPTPEDIDRAYQHRLLALAAARARVTADPAAATTLLAGLRAASDTPAPQPGTVLPDPDPAATSTGWAQRVRHAARTAWTVLTEPHLLPDRCDCGHSRTACRARRKDTP